MYTYQSNKGLKVYLKSSIFWFRSAAAKLSFSSRWRNHFVNRMYAGVFGIHCFDRLHILDTEVRRESTVLLSYKTA